MLAIRLQRQGKKGYPVYRIIVQEKQLTPTSGRVVAHVGHYNPHTKEAVVKADVAQKYLDHGAEPTARVAKLLQDNGVKLPKWVKLFEGTKKGKIRFADKLRKNQPKEKVAKAPAEEAAEETVEVAEVAPEAPTEAPEAPEEQIEAEASAEGGEDGK